MKCLIIKDGTMAPADINAGDYRVLKEILDDWSTSCFRVRLSGDRSLMGMCGDSFLIREPMPPMNVAIGRTLRTDAPYPIGGPIIICAIDYEGNAVPMTDDEMSGFTLAKKPSDSFLPLLNWEY